MGFKINTEKSLVWDQDQNQMVVKTKVTVGIVTNKDTVLAEEGPLYCTTGQEIFEAVQLLRSKLISGLPGLDEVCA